ncbi:MAG: AtpZ/AtpI family protein [Candidatus Eremiobacteraeota bacterium]|nr:AtpZ/AtpI family protein [Candidatus Eremiobacteraeota bacterium]
MKAALPVLAAGGTFAATTVAGLCAGAWLAARMRAPVVVVAGLFLGLALGGYSAYRLLLRSI